MSRSTSHYNNCLGLQLTFSTHLTFVATAKRQHVLQITPMLFGYFLKTFYFKIRSFGISPTYIFIQITKRLAFASNYIQSKQLQGANQDNQNSEAKLLKYFLPWTSSTRPVSCAESAVHRRFVGSELRLPQGDLLGRSQCLHGQ